MPGLWLWDGVQPETVLHSSANIFGNWMENVLYRFAGGTDGAAPVGDLIFDQAGNMYGTDQVGTTGWGSVYTLTPSNGSWKQAVLYNFTGGSDGGGLSGVIFDNAWRLYGAASMAALMAMVRSSG